MPTPLGLSGGYLSDSGQSMSRPNPLLRPQGQSQFNRMDIEGGWFRGPKFRDLLGRGTVKQQINLGPRASANSMLQYNNVSVPSDTNQFNFF